MEMEEEDFIDIDIDIVSSSPEFEFHMTADDPPLPSPADELFYMGKLLPLHLPPRLQMLEQLLRDTSAAVATAYHSCNANGELNPKKSWTKKIKEATLGLKVDASRSYFRSLFHRSRPSNEKLEASKALRRHQNPTLSEDESRSKPSSFSSEFSGGKSTPRRSSSASSDAESLIQGAIAYCKKSSQWAVDSEAWKTTSNDGFYLLSASRIAPECKQAELPHQIRSPPSCCCSRGKKNNFCDAYLLLKHESNAIKNFILAVSVNK
ncbi:probable membrane-associated kinase regulator 4 [Zingiber officinale]|uniref:probable membrane-associated kinase regulator 4 n=1 Tax=Zingiber officinale TaxID=94328 RepID=UPI001C4CF88D|nr:probable membrane-associated kinase regulator 4 [Zingiber officinale]